MRVKSKELLDAVKFVSPALAKQKHIPVYSCVRLIAGDDGQLGVVATDGDLSIYTWLECEGEIEPAVVSAELLTKFLSQTKGDGDLELKDSALSLTFGSANLTLPCIPAEDWPQIVMAQSEPVTLDQDERLSIERILYAASKDQGRPVLTGISFGNGWAVATDSYRLAAVKSAVFTPCIVPVRALDVVFKHAASSITVAIDGVRATFKTHRGVITTRLLSGQYPNWERLVPEKDLPPLTVDRAQLLEALRRVSVVAEDNTPVRLTLGDGTLSIAMHSARGDTTETIAATGELTGTFGFSPAFLRDMAKAGTGEFVSIGIEAINKPAVVGSLDSGSINMLMPVRLG